MIAMSTAYRTGFRVIAFMIGLLLGGALAASWS
jgi:hypothetical protein